jgi:hypothetical protein
MDALVICIDSYCARLKVSAASYVCCSLWSDAALRPGSIHFDYMFMLTVIGFFTLTTVSNQSLFNTIHIAFAGFFMYINVDDAAVSFNVRCV